MRFCPYCRRWNRGKPVLCNYCGRSWYVRLCPRGHENPADAEFCGNCGSADLTDTAGLYPWWLRVPGVLAGLVPVTLFVLSIIGILSHPEQTLSFMISIAFLISAYVMMLSVLPFSLRRFLCSYHKKVLVWAGKGVLNGLRMFIRAFV